MAKQKSRPDRTNFLSNLKASVSRPKATDDRLAILAVELGLAGGEVLQEHFGFSVEKTAKWLDLMLDRAELNRVKSLAKLAIERVNDGR